MADFSVFSPDGGITSLNVKDVSARNMVTDAFSPSTAYAVGDYCIYDGVLYICTTAHEGAWTAGDFAATTIANELKNSGGGGDVWDTGTHKTVEFTFKCNTEPSTQTKTVSFPSHPDRNTRYDGSVFYGEIRGKAITFLFADTGGHSQDFTGSYEPFSCAISTGNKPIKLSDPSTGSIVYNSDTAIYLYDSGPINNIGVSVNNNAITKTFNIYNYKYYTSSTSYQTHTLKINMTITRNKRTFTIVMSPVKTSLAVNLDATIIVDLYAIFP